MYNSPSVELGSSLEDRTCKLAKHAGGFLTNTLPKQVYLHLLLKLPSVYRSRMRRLFENANVSPLDVDTLLQTINCARDQHARMRPITNVGPALIRFKISWESFIDSLLREWKTLNIVSALLLSAILSMFQNQEMAYDPLVRMTALLSLTCALWSLVYGCIYIVQSAMVKSMYKATRWTQEIQKTATFTLWNVQIMLALPGVWLAWSMIFFIASILAFVWRSGSKKNPSTPSPLGPDAEIGPRVFISVLFILGIAYFGTILNTLQEYGRVSGAAEGVDMETMDAIGEGRARRDGEGERERGREGMGCVQG
ncbi:hypothetical protein EDD16DRAFT_1644336 [Pisolithus croceorrhizus]|nr:hypothetical protein EDD16DRAFT_1644336 [Pisolithus croceorrhizus]